MAETAEDGLQLAVEEATAARLIAGTSVVSGIRFTHALIREALYEGISPLRRRSYHQRAGAALAAQPRPDADAIASHFQRAGDARSAAWLIRAGGRAEEAYALGTASERYEAALVLLPDDRTAERGWLLYRAARMRFPRATDYLDEALRCAEATDDWALAAVVHFLRGYARCQLAGADDPRGPLEELVTAANAIMALAPAEHARLAALPGQLFPEKRAPHGTAVIWAALTGRYAQALALAKRWILPAQQPPAALAEGWAGLAYTYAALGQPDAAWAAYERARQGLAGNPVQLANLHGPALQVLVLPYRADWVEERRRLAAEGVAQATKVAQWKTLASHLAVGFLSLVEGRWDDPLLARAEAIVAGAEEAPMPTRIVARRLLAHLYRERGRRAEAWAQVRALLPDGPASEAAVAYRSGGHDTFEIQRLAATLALDAGDLTTAKAWLEAHRRWQAWSGAVLGRSEAAALWARYHWQAGDLAEACASAAAALRHATEPRQPLALLTAHRLLGELDTEAGRFADAAQHLGESLRLADACAAPYERALTLLGCAELDTMTGDTVAAGTALDEARALLERLAVKPALARADALAARLSASHAAPLLYPDGLSAREVEVLRLLAGGMSNQEIADTLSISVRTVERHITNLYAKIGADGRADATAYALRHFS